MLEYKVVDTSGVNERMYRNDKNGEHKCSNPNEDLLLRAAPIRRPVAGGTMQSEKQTSGPNYKQPMQARTLPS